MEPDARPECFCETDHPEGECPSGLTHLYAQSEATTLPPLAERADKLVGQRFGSFQAVRELGRGGMGTVLLAEHVLIPKRVAVKVLHRHLAADRDIVQRLLAEARAMSLVQHENVVTIYDLDTTRDGQPYFVMEYLEGQSLAAFARGPLQPALVVELLAQVCDALGAAHARGIIHRDLKPANVFLVPGPQGHHKVKLLDFGIAKRLSRLEGETPTRTGVIMGTPEFMAPEQCAGREVDARTDLYAVGVLAYLLLTGQAPFSSTSAAAVLVAHLQQTPRAPHELRAGLPPALSEVVLRALAKQPEARFASAAELRAALEASLASAARPAPPPAAPSLSVRMSPQGARGVCEYACERVGRTGLFVSTPEPPPALLSDVPMLLRLRGGELPCTAQVVRHVTLEQARAWNMSPGFGVELRDCSAAFQQAFTRMLSGEPGLLPSGSVSQGEARAEPVLREFRQRLSGDHYTVLGVSRDADAERIRAQAREARHRLEPLLGLALSPPQRAIVQRGLAKVAEALLVLGHVERRVEYDAELHNLEGVLRCLAGGLTVTALEACRRRYLSRHPQFEGHALLHLASAEAFQSAGRLSEALASCEAAVKVDPLHLEALKRWHALRVRMRQSTAAPAASR